MSDFPSLEGECAHVLYLPIRLVLYKTKRETQGAYFFFLQVTSKEAEKLATAVAIKNLVARAVARKSSATKLSRSLLLSRQKSRTAYAYRVGLFLSPRQCYNKTIMDQNTLNQLKTALEQEKKSLTEELQSIAEPDKHLKGDWDAKYTDMGNEWDDNAQEVTEYATRVPLEHKLELRLLEVNAALAKIDHGTYGICEICGEAIPVERLTANPAARTCTEHSK